MPFTPPSALSSTSYKNFAESSDKNNSGLPPKSHTQSRTESRRDGRNSKAFPNGNSPMEMRETKANGPISRIRAVLRPKLHRSNSSQDSIEPTRRDIPVPLKIEEANQFLEATSTNTQENTKEGPSKPIPNGPWPTCGYSTPPVESPTTTDPLISSLFYSPRYRPRPSLRGYYSTDYPPYSSSFGNGYSFAATPSPRYTDATERRESSSNRWPRPNTFKRSPRYTSEGFYSTPYEFYDERIKRRRAWAERSAQRRRENLSPIRHSRSYGLYTTTGRYSRYHSLYTTFRPKVPTRCKIRLEKYVPEETEDVPFQYQDPYQYPTKTLSKPQGNGASSRGRILAQRRKKRSHGMKTQQSSLDSTSDLIASAEVQSRDDESPSGTVPQLMGRHKLSKWKLNSGNSKDWRRKPSAKILTTRQCLTAVYSHKKLHYSTVHAEGLEMAAFDPDIPVAAYRNRRGEKSMVGRNEFPELVPWLDRTEFRYMRMKRDYIRDISNGEEFEVEAHWKLGLGPHFQAEKDWDIDASARLDEWSRQIQYMQAYPSAKISQNANPPHYLQFQYIGRVISSPHGYFQFQLLEHMESSAHAEIYKICDLTTGHERLARIYTLRGIHPNQRKRRVENLKKFSQLKRIGADFDWEGKKVCVFSYRYQNEYMSMLGEDSTSKAAGIGAIGRRNTKEYDLAFPALPPSTPIPVPTNVPEEATESLTPEQQLQIKTLELIRSEIEETSSKNWESISKGSLPLAQRLMIRLMDLNGESVGNRSSEWKVRDRGVRLKNEGNGKWHEDGKGKNSEVKMKKKRRRKKKSEKGFVV